MRKVKYRTYWGPTDIFWRGRKNSLAEFVLDILYFIADTGIIPPLAVLNEVLQDGGYTGGMSPGTKWKPFVISETEYAELVKELLLIDGRVARKKHPFVTFERLRADAELDKIADYSSWFKKTLAKYPYK